jgi:D-alanyl-lipoteichoic acid acyltransferase DltB (MBOAT superfamily)
MLFNSYEFALFLPAVFALYWFVFNKNLRAQNLLLLASSYIFYGWWDVRFLGLLVLSSVMDFSLGVWMGVTQEEKKRKWLLGLSLLLNLGLLGTFKYFNFFVASFVDAFASAGIHLQATTLQIVLPVGISFYTFQSLSYTIDVYRRQLEPTRSIIDFLAFVSFFPQLVAGPIERATNLLPQFYVTRQFSYEKAVDGTRQMLWGLFKKVVVADNCAIYVNDIFANYSTLSGVELILGSVLFAFQIYCDFSGYSDVAIGCAKLFGFQLMTNFRYPYFSRDMAEFWRRWHISLSTWFRDYLYMPLGGSRVGFAKTIRNIFIIFIVSGFWHGANWTFIAWGALNALYFVPLYVFGMNRQHLSVVAENSALPTPKETLQMLVTFTLTCIAWVFFRAESMSHAFNYLAGIFTSPFLPKSFWYFNLFTLCAIAFTVAVEWRFRRCEHPFQTAGLPRPLRWSLYLGMFFLVLNFLQYKAEFIYFQF